MSQVIQNNTYYNVYNIPKLVSLGVSPPSKFMLIEQKIKSYENKKMDIIPEIPEIPENSENSENSSDIYDNKFENKIIISKYKKNKIKKFMDTIYEILENEYENV